MKHVDILVRGGGIVGQSLALAMARLGLSVALVAPKRPQAAPDVRAYALNAASVALLQQLRVWDALPASAITPVYEMRVCGDASPSTLEFTAWQQREGELACIVDAAVLEARLAAAIGFAPHVARIDSAQAPEPTAALEALCDGSGSRTRAAHGAAFEPAHYHHQGIAARLVAPHEHHGIAQQWFRSPDVIALLPLDTPVPGRSYALVWSAPDAMAQRLMALDAADFAVEVSAACRGAVGALELASERSTWPLMLAHAEPWHGPGWVLLGDAAHVVHPLAGQGLNLGLADVAALARVVAARETWRGLGDERLLRRYARVRQAPTRAVGAVTDGLLTLFAHDAPAVRLLRNRGLDLVNGLTPLKRWLTGHAIRS